MSLPLAYSVRNVRARLRRTALTVTVIALAVIATAVFLALVSSLRRTLVSTGSPDNLVILRKGSDNDGSSMLPLEAYQAIRYLDGIARDADGQPLVSPEMVVQPQVTTHRGSRENVLVRGVEPPAFAVHDQVRLKAGRMFQPSAGEIVLGIGTVGRYVGAELGSEMAFGRRRWRVVGIMEAAGSSFESEIWGDAREVAADSTRPFPYSGVRVRLAPGADREALVRRIEDDPRFALEATPEIDYYKEQAESAQTLYMLLVILALPIGIARRVRLRQHHVRGGAGAHGGDRDAACARLLARAPFCARSSSSRSRSRSSASRSARLGRSRSRDSSASCSAGSASPGRRSPPTW